MVVVPLHNPSGKPQVAPVEQEQESNCWLRVAAGGALLVSGALLLNGKHRAGLLAALAGTSMAMLDQQETVVKWWSALPSLINDGARVIGQVQGVVDNLDSQRERIRTLVGR
jgi:hypothetical protein